MGQRRASATIRDIATELHLDWETVKDLNEQYMRAQLARAGTPGPLAIGVDEISFRNGHPYRIVVSDLERHGPIWFGGEDHPAASMGQFYRWLADKKSARFALALMDIWKPFRNATQRCARRRPS